MGGRGEENGGEGMRCPKSRLAFRGWTWGRGHSDLFVEKTTGPPPPFLCAAGTRTLRPVPRGHPQIRKHGEKIRPVARLPGEGASGRQADACRVLRLRKSFAQDSCVCVHVDVGVLCPGPRRAGHPGPQARSVSALTPWFIPGFSCANGRPRRGKCSIITPLNRAPGLQGTRA